VIAKVEGHPGELYPRVGFIVTTFAHSAENIVAFYNKRGTCEQWIKEGKGAIKWTRLSYRSFINFDLDFDEMTGSRAQRLRGFPAMAI
jgi:Transposase DDE domain group 1